MSEHNIMSIEVWPESESISIVVLVVAGDVFQAIDVAKDVARATEVWHDETVGIQVEGIDMASFLYERNQEVALWY